MRGLDALLNDIIPSEGPLSLARYMTLCLEDPDWGYYATREPFGKKGDFITAPEISQIFGELVGLWAADYWLRAGLGEPMRLVEMGPGRGSLMADAVRAISAIGDISEAPDGHFVESSARLRGQQRKRLKGQWHADIHTLPGGPAIYIANEFFDALPIHQFVLRDVGWRERCVTAENGSLTWIEEMPSDIFNTLPNTRLSDASGGDILEYCVVAQEICKTIADAVVREGGAALIIDYGYQEAAFGDSFQAVQRHRYADPLAAPGEADLTAHVDFGMLRGTAEATGAKVWGPVPQGRFLTELGITVRADQLKERATLAQAKEIDSAVKRLTSPAEMGQLFKAMAVTPPQGPTPGGF